MTSRAWVAFTKVIAVIRVVAKMRTPNAGLGFG